jgi:hypothetical protein
VDGARGAAARAEDPGDDGDQHDGQGGGEKSFTANAPAALGPA